LAWGVWIGFDWLRTGTGGGCCECGYEPSGFCSTELVSYLQKVGELVPHRTSCSKCRYIFSKVFRLQFKVCTYRVQPRKSV
jgi:hypothetical protein